MSALTTEEKEDFSYSSNNGELLYDYIINTAGYVTDLEDKDFRELVMDAAWKSKQENEGGERE